jgi:hypothetical protein
MMLPQLTRYSDGELHLRVESAIDEIKLGRSVILDHELYRNDIRAILV